MQNDRIPLASAKGRTFPEEGASPSFPLSLGNDASTKLRVTPCDCPKAHGFLPLQLILTWPDGATVTFPICPDDVHGHFSFHGNHAAISNADVQAWVKSLLKPSSANVSARIDF
ncbi:hypothetical protein KL86APRO_10461 [uncultured Alphaproteobacteria bacterium]|uniref:Uncharacterized protein n=1 Tax=uncultured Alphaproteobacteria bacterium TaxID=91750 RepID=A0A212J3K9_9PROT|nr:hypothetical protein KL86APRO_10461 [uncultured Alphaproteobacteria bacterium]